MTIFPERRFLLAGRLGSRVLAGLLLGLAISWGLSARAQVLPHGEALFLGVKKSDRVSVKGATPDGHPDAVFALNVGTRPVDPRITEIALQAVSGAPGTWTSSGKTPGAGYLGVARAKSPGEILNRRGGNLNLNPKSDKDLLLFVTDDGAFDQEDRRYEVKVTLKDGTGWSFPVRVESKAASASPGAAAAAYPVRMTAVLKGISNYDAVGPGKTISGDDKADGLFVLTVEAKDKEITAIEIRNVDGTPSVWDTVPSSSNDSIGVALATDPVRLLNQRDGSVAIQVKDRVELNLYVADNGSIAAGKTTYRISVKFSDGGLSWCAVEKAPPTQPAAEEKTASAAPQVNFLGTWLGFVSTDAVGQYAGLKPDGKPDAVFGLDIEVTPYNTITGIEIESMDGPQRKWSTNADGAWGMAVAYQNAPSSLLNKADGTIRIGIEGRVQFYLYVADPGDLANTASRLRVVVHLADGSSYQQLVRRPAATTSTVVPGTEEAQRAKGLITCEFRGFVADMVNTSTRPGKDGYLDGTFIMKLQVEDKKLAKVEVKGADGTVRWSSDPRSPVMFLGLALYPKIYKLINEKGGMLQVPISGRRTIYLYAADNGLLSDPASVLTVVVTFTDKTTLTAEVIK